MALVSEVEQLGEVVITALGIQKEAKKLGAEVNGSEIVGLVPLEAILNAGRFYSNNKVTDEKELVDLAIEKLELSSLNKFVKEEKIIDYMI